MPKGSIKRVDGTLSSVRYIAPASAASPAPSADALRWHHELASRALAGEGPASGTDSPVVAAAAAAAMRAVFVALDPLLGSQAMRALYGRSLYLARSSFTPAVAMPGLGEDVFQPLLTHLAARAPADARAAGLELLVTFAELLITFLGQPIAKQVLRAAWGSSGTPIATRSCPE